MPIYYRYLQMKKLILEDPTTANYLQLIIPEDNNVQLQKA